MRRLLLLTLLALLGSARTPVVAQVPPGGEWRTVESTHARVTYQAGLDSLARHAAARTDVAWQRLARTLTRPPSGKVDVVLTDNVDFTNGYATPLPSNRIVIYARPPIDVPGLEHYRDWLDLVITHELTHIFHLDRAGRFGMALRAAFGRLPFAWPVFPAVGTPRWSIEGLATHVESEYTGAGRVHGTYHAMVVRTAVLEDRFDPIDRATASSPIWPGDERVYIYGSLFLDYLAEQYGEDVRGKMVDRTASAAIPPILWFGGVGRRTLGKSWGTAYREWRESLTPRYSTLADSLRALGVTEAEPVITHGRWAVHPRISPDHRFLAYTAQENDQITKARIVELGTGRIVREHRRNGIGPSSWLPRGEALAFSQFEFDGPYQVYQDLFYLDEGREVRLTSGGRLQDPDPDRHGERLVAVENRGGSTRLVVFRNSDLSTRVLLDFDPAVQWASPRWAPDGDRIAAVRWTRGGEYDVVVLDTMGQVVRLATVDRALVNGPAWSPDGRTIVFSSDRTGISNLYASELGSASPVVRQVTNVLTGAFYPDVSPDGRWIYYAEYHSDGYRIVRIPFDPATWRSLPPLTVAPSLGRAAAEPAGAPAVSEARGYSPVHSLLPKFWSPVGYGGDVPGDGYWGLSSGGTDLLGRHGWGGFFAIDPDSRRWEGSLAYAFAGLENPVLQLEANRTWDNAGLVVFPDSSRRDVAESEDVVALLATLLRRRWRSSASFSVGVEGVLRRRTILDPPTATARLTDPRDALYGLLARFGYASYLVPPYAISREDGVALFLTGRTRVEPDPFEDFDRGYREATAFAAAYRSLDLPGFAHHVAALRGSLLARDGLGASTQRIGGASGGALNALGMSYSAESTFLPIRGFEYGVRRGTIAWSGSAEYRFPLAIVGRRPSLSPLYVDRLSGSLFIDAGDAWCTGEPARRFLSCQPEFGGSDGPRSPLVGAGAEFVLDAALAAIAGGRFRFGGGLPVSGEGDGARFYLQFGASF